MNECGQSCERNYQDLVNLAGLLFACVCVPWPFTAESALVQRVHISRSYWAEELLPVVPLWPPCCQSDRTSLKVAEGTPGPRQRFVRIFPMLEVCRVHLKCVEGTPMLQAIHAALKFHIHRSSVCFQQTVAWWKTSE